MRKLFCLLGMLLLLMSGIPALADSISPDSFSATLAPGESVTISKTVTISAGTPTSSKVDVFFLADTTGSMGGTIGSVIASAGSILTNTTGLGDVQWGVGAYRDIGDTFVYQLRRDITSDTSLVSSAISSWAAGGGGDYPEAELFALQQVANTTTWRAGSARILVWMGDAPGHDPSSGVTEAGAIAALNAKNIKALAVNVAPTSWDYYAPFGGINYGLNDMGQAKRIADGTSGTLYSGINSSSVVAAIEDAITSAFTTYSTIGLDISGAPAGVAVGKSGGCSGSFSREAERTCGFDVTFTGVTEGVYGFNIYATVDGGRVATEADRITVTAIPEPGSIVLLGTVMLGVATVVRRRRRV